MARELQDRVLALVEDALDVEMGREVRVPWLARPGRAECGHLWGTIQGIYGALTDGGVLPEEMPLRERRSLDAVLVDAQGRHRIVEVDEVQHFTPPRAVTLGLYPPGAVTAFDRETWRARSAEVTKLRGGGFGRPTPPLFPDPGGRHLQRAYRDALADLLPTVHGWEPTLRIGDFEVKDWLHAPDALARMAALLDGKFGTAA